jgi:hypothetical protein
MDASPYRVPVRPAPDPYAAGWAKIRRARNAATVSVLGILGCGSLIYLAADLRSVFAAVLLEVGVGAFIVLGLTRWDDARCPRCDAPFFGTRLAMFARRCTSCRIEMGTEADAKRRDYPVA